LRSIMCASLLKHSVGIQERENALKERGEEEAVQDPSVPDLL